MYIARTSYLIGYGNILDKGLKGSISLIVLSVVSTTIAGPAIGNFFMNPSFLSNMFGGVLVFVAIHGADSLVGGALGVVLIRGFESRQAFSREDDCTARERFTVHNNK